MTNSTTPNLEDRRITAAHVEDLLRTVRRGFVPGQFDAPLVAALEASTQLLAWRDAALAVCDTAEHGATRWADPLEIPPLVGLVRRALGVPACLDCCRVTATWEEAEAHCRPTAEPLASEASA